MSYNDLTMRAKEGGIELIFWTDNFIRRFSGTIFSRISFKTYQPRITVKQSHYGPSGWIVVQLYPFVTSALEGGGWSTPRPGRFTSGKNPVPIVQEAGWAQGSVWACAENLTPTGIRSPDRPASSQLLYRLSYRAHASRSNTININNLQKKLGNIIMSLYVIPDSTNVNFLKSSNIWVCFLGIGKNNRVAV
jgi:hypothetical protein